MREVIGEGVFYEGDALEILPTLDAGKFALILLDLPYGTTRNGWDSVLPLESLWPEHWRLGTPNAAVVATAQTPFDKILGVSALAHLRYEWVWEKSNATGHLNAKRAPMKAHENVLVFYRKQPTYNPQKTEGHPLKSANKKHTQTSNYGQQRGVSRYHSTERYPRSVLRFPSDKQKVNLHPTQKPVALIEYFIKTYTNTGDWVLDYTAGSGTTAVAAEMTGRRWVCIEKEATYADVARERVKTAVAASVL